MSATMTRWGGPAAVLGGAIWCLFWLGYMAAGAEIYPSRMGLLAVPAISALLLALGAAALHRGAVTKLGAIGKAGVLLAAGGMALFALGAFIAAAVWPAAYAAAILGELATSVGLLIFGAANLGDHALSRWNGLPLLLALAYPPSWMLDPGALPLALRQLPDLLAALYGFGWMLLGVRQWLDAGQVRAQARTG